MEVSPTTNGDWIGWKLGISWFLNGDFMVFEWGYPKMDGFWWVIRGNPFRMDEKWGYPYFRKHPYEDFLKNGMFSFYFITNDFWSPMLMVIVAMNHFSVSHFEISWNGGTSTSSMYCVSIVNHPLAPPCQETSIRYNHRYYILFAAMKIAMDISIYNNMDIEQN